MKLLVAGVPAARTLLVVAECHDGGAVGAAPCTVAVFCDATWSASAICDAVLTACRFTHDHHVTDTTCGRSRCWSGSHIRHVDSGMPARLTLSFEPAMRADAGRAWRQLVTHGTVNVTVRYARTTLGLPAAALDVHPVFLDEPLAWVTAARTGVRWLKLHVVLQPVACSTMHLALSDGEDVYQRAMQRAGTDLLEFALNLCLTCPLDYSADDTTNNRPSYYTGLVLAWRRNTDAAARRKTLVVARRRLALAPSGRGLFAWLCASGEDATLLRIVDTTAIDVSFEEWAAAAATTMLVQALARAVPWLASPRRLVNTWAMHGFCPADATPLIAAGAISL